MQKKFKRIPLVSVIVPAYNEEKHLEECLASICNQTYTKIELIVVDDYSKDSTPKIAKRYAEVFLSQRHQGPGIARNKAAKIAKGDILVFIDADMYLDKDYIFNIIKPIINGQAVATFTKEEYIANPQNMWVKCHIYDNNLKENKKNIESDLQQNYFRAIFKDYFLSKRGYNVKFGYNDDHFFTKKNKIKSICAKGAICYHYNPCTLKDIFLSARWIGRSPMFRKTVYNLLKYSFFNSIRVSIKKINEGAPSRFIFYKIIFDLGIFMGILHKNEKLNYAK